jgi:hypothetical protein
VTATRHPSAISPEKRSRGDFVNETLMRVLEEFRCVGWSQWLGRAASGSRGARPERNAHVVGELSGDEKQERAVSRRLRPLPPAAAATPEWVYRARARRSASSSQPATAVNVAARAGTPFGNRVFSRPSRSTPSARPGRAWRLAPFDGAGAVARRRVVAALRVRPATPCTRLRCAPSAAARVNVLPHSGQTSSMGFD